MSVRRTIARGYQLTSRHCREVVDGARARYGQSPSQVIPTNRNSSLIHQRRPRPLSAVEFASKTFDFANKEDWFSREGFQLESKEDWFISQMAALVLIKVEEICSQIFFFIFNLFCFDLNFFFSIATSSVLISNVFFFIAHLFSFAYKSLFWFQIYSFWLNNKETKFSPYMQSYLSIVLLCSDLIKTHFVICKVKAQNWNNQSFTIKCWRGNHLWDTTTDK